MQVLDLLLSSGVTKQDPQLAEVFQITSVSDNTFPYLQKFFLPDPKETSASALIGLAARAIKQPNTAWQPHQFPQESVTMQKLPLPGDTIQFQILPDISLEIQQTESHGMYVVACILSG